MTVVVVNFYSVGKSCVRLVKDVICAVSLTLIGLKTAINHLPNNCFFNSPPVQMWCKGGLWLTSWAWNLLNREKLFVNIHVQLNYRYVRFINQNRCVILCTYNTSNCLNKNAVVLFPSSPPLSLWLQYFKWWGGGESKAETGHMTQIWKHFVAGFGSWKCHYSFHGMHEGKIK